MSYPYILMVELYAHDGSGVVRNRYADEDFVGLAGDPYVPLTFVPGRVEQPGLWDRKLYGGGGTRGDIAIGSAAVVLTNPDGELDGLFPMAFDGRTFYCWEYNPSGIVHNALIFGAIEQATFSDDKITFQVRDPNHQFDAPLMSLRYLGSNVLPAGVEGVAGDIKGQVKPLVVGKVKNITPVCVNTSRLIYEVDGQRGLLTGWALQAYDKRAALTQGADYASAADMQSTAPSAGQYRVYPAGGQFRLGSAPTGQITADVTNPASTTVGTTHCEVYAVLAYLGGSGGAFATLDHALSASPDVGIYITEETTRLRAMSEVAASVNAFVRYSLVSPATGLALGYIVSQLTEPATPPYTPLAQELELDEDNIISLARVVQADPERGIPVWRVNVNYGKNYTVMSATELAGVALADQEFCAREYRTVTATASIGAQWPLAPELTIDTLLDTQAAAQAEADRLLALHSVRRDVFTVEIPGDIARGIQAVSGPLVYKVDLQSQVEITYPRYGLDAGKTFLVIGMREDLNKDTVELTVWG